MLLKQFSMKLNKNLALLLFLSLYSCKTYKKTLIIEQSNNKKNILVKFTDYSNNAVISFPVSFRIKNNTSKDRFLYTHTFNYSNSLNGFVGSIYRTDNDTIVKTKFGQGYLLKKGQIENYLHYTYHIMDTQNQLNIDKLKSLENNKSRNKEGKFEFSNLDEFKKLFPNFLKNEANKDQLSISLGKQNGKYEYLTLNVQY